MEHMKLIKKHRSRVKITLILYMATLMLCSPVFAEEDSISWKMLSGEQQNLLKTYKEKWTPHLFEFAYEYASDTGNEPAC